MRAPRMDSEFCVGDAERVICLTLADIEFFTSARIQRLNLLFPGAEKSKKAINRFRVMAFRLSRLLSHHPVRGTRITTTATIRVMALSSRRRTNSLIASGNRFATARAASGEPGTEEWRREVFISALQTGYALSMWR